MTSRLPFDQPHPLQPPPQLRRLQAQGPVHRVRTRVGHDAWLVTGYAEVRALLDDDRLGRAHPDPANAARSGESALFGGPMGDYATEHTDHARMRALLRPHFTPRRMRALRPRVEELTTGLLDDLALRRPPVDLNEALALPLPILVICELLGVPYADRDQFRSLTQAAADVTDRARSERGLSELFDYGRQLVARKRHHPADDVISRLLEADGVGDDEIAVLAMSLLFAGHETTVVRIAMGTLHLLTHPDQYQALAKDPGTVPDAVEEILRVSVTGGDGIPRYARADIDIAGVTVRAGDLVLCDNGAANHDPGTFADPGRFDITRGATPHLTFGHGARYCLGAPLARLELQAVFTQLPSRFPTLRPSIDVEDLALRTDTLTGGPVELPVTW